jgi:cytochrome P450
MRLWPTAGGSIRDVEHDLYYNDMLLPKGSTILIQHFAIFRADWINDAHQYDPNRWLDTNPQLSKLKEMFTPFGIGKRGCIGQNMAMFQLRIIIAFFICYFEFEFVQEPTF